MATTHTTRATLTPDQFDLLVTAVEVLMDEQGEAPDEGETPLTRIEYRKPGYCRFHATSRLYQALVAQRGRGTVAFDLTGAEYAALQDAVEGAEDVHPDLGGSLYATLVAAGVCR